MNEWLVKLNEKGDNKSVIIQAEYIEYNSQLPFWVCLKTDKKQIVGVFNVNAVSYITKLS